MKIALSLTQLQSLISDIIDTISSFRALHRYPSMRCLFIHVINDIIFIKKGNKFKDASNDIQQHLTFITWLISNVSSHVLIEFDFDQLKQLFHLFVLNASNERERFVMLNMYSLIWRNWRAYDTMTQFCTQYFEPLMREYRYTSDDQMITKLFHCFHQYYNNLLCKDSDCVSLLKLNRWKMINCIMNQLNEMRSTPDGNYVVSVLQIKHLLYALSEVQSSVSSKTLRVSLSNANTNVILTDMFYTFASDKDVTMSPNDIRRYIIAMGRAGTNKSASKLRIGNMFNQYADDKGQFTLTSFLNSYNTAVVERPDSVWNDLYMFGYNNDLKLTLYNEYHESDNIIDFVSNHSKYYAILNTLLTQMDTNPDYNPAICESILPVLIKLPKCKKMQKQMYDGLLNSLLAFDHNNMNQLNRMIYNVMVLYSLRKQMDTKWKEVFIKKKGVDYLLKMLIQFSYSFYMNRDYYENSQCYHLAEAFLIRILHQVCGVNHSLCTLMNTTYASMNTVAFHVLNRGIMELEENHLVSLVCLDAQSSQNQQMEFLYDISRPIGHTYCKPLIFGYIHECETAQNIPNDIMKLLLRFFF